MTAGATQSLILNTLATFGSSVLVIITAIIGVAVAYLIFRWGWNQVDNSLTVGGYYLKELPYKGYNRFRSKKWNMENM